jgi:hypothetical protein
LGVSLFDSGTRVDDSSRNGNAAYWRAAEDTVWPQHTPKWQRSLKERLHTFKERLMASAGYLAVPGTASAGERSRYLKAAAGMAGLSLALLGIGLGALIAPYATSQPAILAADATPKLLVEDLRPQEEGSNQVAASSGNTSSVAPLTLKLDAPAQTAQAQSEASSGTETSETQTASTQITDELLGADMAPGMAEPATPVTPERITRTVAVGRGDTLMGVLVDKGAVREDAHMAIAAMRSHYDPRKLRAGQELELTFEEWPREADTTANADEEAPSNTLLSMAIKTDVDRQVAVHRMADGTYKGEEIVTELKTGFVQAKATIDSSLFLAANDAGIPPAITVELIRMYSYDIDFQREIRVGDSFEVFFARDYDENGVAVREGQVLYAAMTVGGKKRQLWRFDPGDGNWDYFDQNGPPLWRLRQLCAAASRQWLQDSLCPYERLCPRHQGRPPRETGPGNRLCRHHRPLYGPAPSLRSHGQRQEDQPAQNPRADRTQAGESRAEEIRGRAAGHRSEDGRSAGTDEGRQSRHCRIERISRHEKGRRFLRPFLFV